MDVCLRQAEPGLTATIKLFPQTADEDASAWQSEMADTGSHQHYNKNVSLLNITTAYPISMCVMSSVANKQKKTLILM